MRRGKHDGSPRFLFLHETTDPVSKDRDAAEQRAIHSHVQRNSSRAKQKAAIKRSRRIAWGLPTAAASRMPLSALGIRLKSPGRETGSVRELRISSGDDESESSSGYTSHTSDDPSDATGQTVRKFFPSWFGAAELDPFVTELPKKTNYILAHYVKSIIPLAYTVRAGANWAAREILELAFTAPIVLQSLLAVSSVRDLSPSHTGIPISPHASTSDHLRHKITTIQMINDAMAHPVDATSPSTLFAIWNISTVEVMTGNATERNLHLRGINYVLSTRGGLQGLPGFLVEILVAAFLSNAVVTGATPELTPPAQLESFCQGTMTSAIHSSRRLRTLFSGLTDSALSSYLSAEMLTVIEDLRDYTLFYEHQHEQDMKLQDYHYLSMKGLDIEYRLLVSRFSPRLLERILCAPLLFFKDALYEIHDPTSPLHRSLTGEIKLMLENVDFFHEEWMLANEALVWVLSVGVYHSAADNWFVQKLAHLVQHLRLGSWDDFRLILSRFGYLERLFEGPMRKVWEEVEKTWQDLILESFLGLLS